MFRVVGNYLWVNLVNSYVGATSPHLVTSAAGRECDCYNELTISFTIAGNTSLAGITARVLWYDINHTYLFSEDTSAVSTSSGSTFEQFAIKGRYAAIQLVGAVDPTVVLTSFVAILLKTTIG